MKKVVLTILFIIILSLVLIGCESGVSGASSAEFDSGYPEGDESQIKDMSGTGHETYCY